MSEPTAFSEYERNRNEMVVDAIMDEEFDKLYDHDFQVVFGKIPAQCVFRTRFSSDLLFRVWVHRLVRRYYFWVRKANYPDHEKSLISTEIYNALGEWPDPSWFKQRKTYRKRGK